MAIQRGLQIFLKAQLPTLPDADVATVAALYPEWRVGIAVKVGEVYQWDGTLIEVVQAHTTQADWTPDKTPALWRVFRTPAPGTPTWQPNIAVKVGEHFTHDGKTYRVVQAHTTQVGWEPPNVPALWALVA